MSKYVQDNEWGTKYPNFRKEEFKCPCCGSYGKGIATTLLDTLQELRTKKGKAIAISSGYRCSKYNKRVGGDSNSAHLIGAAADFYFEDGSLANQNTRVALVNELKKTKYYHYCYCNVNGNHPNMGAAIHFDSNIVDTSSSTREERVKSLQRALNADYKCGLVVDGSFGPKTESASHNHYLYLGKKGATNHIKWLQTRLIELGYSCGKSGVDGSYGYDTQNAVKKFQNEHGLQVDGCVGKATHKALIK